MPHNKDSKAAPSCICNDVSWHHWRRKACHTCCQGLSILSKGHILPALQQVKQASPLPVCCSYELAQTTVNCCTVHVASSCGMADGEPAGSDPRATTRHEATETIAWVPKTLQNCYIKNNLLDTLLLLLVLGLLLDILVILLPGACLDNTLEHCASAEGGCIGLRNFKWLTS